MSSSTIKGTAALGGGVIEQSTAVPQRNAAVARGESNAEEIHASTTIIERVANMPRGYLAWIARQSASITGKEPAIDSDAEASWRAR